MAIVSLLSKYPRVLTSEACKNVHDLRKIQCASTGLGALKLQDWTMSTLATLPLRQKMSSPLMSTPATPSGIVQSCNVPTVPYAALARLSSKLSFDKVLFSHYGVICMYS